jgi:phage terminase large subunit-like protein
MNTVNLDDIAGRALRKAGYTARVELTRASLERVPYTGDDFIAWCESEFYIPERIGKNPPAMLLDPYQKAALREAHRLTEDGRFVYSLVLWSDIKKSIKSCIAAAETLFRALKTPYYSAKIVANDLKQANSRVFGYIVRAIELNERLQDRCTVRNYRIMFDNHAIIEAIPVDPQGEAGGNDDFIEFTELHAATSKKHQQMWTEMTLSPTKAGLSQRWIDTYAGYSGESPILEPLYETVVKEGTRVPTAIPGLELFRNGTTLALWNTHPRLVWQTPEYYASESRTLLPNEYRRIHGNEWVTSEDTFVPMEWWEACRGILPVEDKYREVVVGVDAAVSGDCFGILAVSREGNLVIPRFVRKWVPPPGGVIEYSNVEDPEDTEYPEGVLRWLAADRNVIAFGYDPYQLHHLCTSLENDNVGYFVPFSQGADRLKADKQTRDIIRDRKILHDGNADLTEHIQNANARTEGDKLRIVKRSLKFKIDLAVCLSMATSLAYDMLPE